VAYEPGLEEPALCRHGYRLGARVGAQLVEGRGEVPGDGAFGDEELVADGLSWRGPWRGPRRALRSHPPRKVVRVERHERYPGAHDQSVAGVAMIRLLLARLGRRS
jgi:hypothetical protein